MITSVFVAYADSLIVCSQRLLLIKGRFFLTVIAVCVPYQIPPPLPVFL